MQCDSTYPIIPLPSIWLIIAKSLSQTFPCTYYFFTSFFTFLIQFPHGTCCLCFCYPFLSVPRCILGFFLYTFMACNSLLIQNNTEECKQIKWTTFIKLKQDFFDSTLSKIYNGMATKFTVVTNISTWTITRTNYLKSCPEINPS